MLRFVGFGFGGFFFYTTNWDATQCLGEAVLCMPGILILSQSLCCLDQATAPKVFLAGLEALQIMAITQQLWEMENNRGAGEEFGAITALI